MKRFIKKGTLHIIDHHNNRHSFIGAFPGQEITIQLHTKAIMKRLCWQPELALGEGYMNGDITIEGDAIYNLLYLLADNEALDDFSIFQTLYTGCQHYFKKFKGCISALKARANVAHHYDLPPALYALFLDQDWQYSCAYYRDLNNDLETAQLDKKRHIAAKLCLQPGQTILDIGCGWGGLALYLAKTWDVHVTGVTLSEEQYKIANARAKEAGLSHKVKFLLCDYRSIANTYDRIVSVGMFEHVGLTQYKIFFSKVHSLLNPDGLALLHSIGVEYNAGVLSPWITKYIFPGGYLPTLSEVFPAIEAQRFHVTDVEILHHHYAATLNAWRQRFMTNLNKLPKELDGRFVRMWEFYLAGCEVSFRKRGCMVFQMQMVKNKAMAPLTRDYIFEYECADPKNKDISNKIIK